MTPAATIVLHLPSYRRRALELTGERERRAAEQAYDANIGGYVDFLQQQARAAGFAVSTDQDDRDAAFSINERSRDDKKAAHDWLQSQPDIWNWMPSSDGHRN